jgi:ABC-type uncharacterized transport system YnjBCD ATPase subunit
MTNDFVSLFKDTSVAFAISVWELATAYRELANASGQFLLLGVAVSAFYLAMSLPMAHLARLLERRLPRSRDGARRRRRAGGGDRMIRVTGLRKRFGSSEILKGIDFEVPPQTVLGVIGASGSGKSTLLRCLNGLETINGGSIDVDGVRLEANLSHADYRRRVKDLRRKVGTVFQHFYLFPHLSVVGNIIEAPVHVLRTPKKTAESEAYELLEAVGLRQAARRYPGRYQAASNSASRLRERSRCIRRCCCSTSRRARSIHVASTACARYCGRSWIAVTR